MILVLFTTSYPYDFGAEQTFLEEEVRILAGKFERVILVPRYCVGNKFPLPDGIEVDESYAGLFSGKRLSIPVILRSIFSTYLLLDLVARPSILLHPAVLARLVKFIGNAILTREWIKSWLLRYSLDPSELVFYTYWFDDASMGIGMTKRDAPDICVISRAHGYDLYEERHDFAYWPCRRAAISLMDRVFPDSESGIKYLQSKYPEFCSKYETSLLGVTSPGFLVVPSQDRGLRIVSCSRLVPVKRVDLLMEGVLQAARSRSEIQFYWKHFGEGDTRGQMQAYAARNFPPNASASFPGYESRQVLYDFYRNNPVDVFVNVSESEGTPVAVMEAIGCGIPVIATAVGGNTEVVSERNGILLSANPGPDEIALALIDMFEHRNQSEGKRIESFRVWQEKYDASVNFANFADLLIKIRNQRG